MRRALGEWAKARAKDYEVVAQRRDADGPMIDRALEIVRRFIVERGLILFGGLAIDYAARLKGSAIYPDDQRPDFDFFSPRSVDDAYDLADILGKAGFEGVGAVRGIHVQTMKVRTEHVWVADIGYAPPDVFAKIPTFDYRGMRVVHPDYQRMDMHLAFCFPFSGQPREDVFHRWAKDLRRFNLLETLYPVGAAAGAAAPAAATATARLAAPGAARVALHGFAAYAAVRAALDELALTLDLGTPVVAAPRLALDFPDDHTVRVEVPAGVAGAASTLIFASPWPEEAAGEGAERYDPYMDVYPESFHAGNAVILSTRGRRLAASLIRAREGTACVVTPQLLLMWLLFEGHRAEPAAAAVYRSYYAHTLEILRAAEGIYAGMLAASKSAESVMDSFAVSPFAPTLMTIGDLNLDSAYVIKMAGNAARLRDTPPPVLGLPADIADLLRGLPANYYFETAKQRPAFAYDANPLFRRSGLRAAPVAVAAAEPAA